MSYSPTARKKAQKINTPENIQKWNKLYMDGIVDGDRIRILEPIYHLKAGSEATIQIRWNSRVSLPVRTTIFEKEFEICGLPHVKWEKIMSTKNKKVICGNNRCILNQLNPGYCAIPTMNPECPLRRGTLDVPGHIAEYPPIEAIKDLFKWWDSYGRLLPVEPYQMLGDILERINNDMRNIKS